VRLPSWMEFTVARSSRTKEQPAVLVAPPGSAVEPIRSPPEARKRCRRRSQGYRVRSTTMTSQSQNERVIQWLLDGDPAIRWQTLRDLVDAAERTVERERHRVARDGWGARLLARQDAEGTWAGGQSSDGGLYSPKWTSTTYTMLMLRDFGLPAQNRQARKACKLLLDGGLQQDAVSTTASGPSGRGAVRPVSPG
jgi:hypothetical protein